MNDGPRKLRDLMRKGLVTAPGAFDPFTARIIESIGFPAIYLAGNAMGLQLCAGQPLVTMTETVDAARKVLAAIEVPLIVDAGAGFGEPAHTHRAVRELERAGIAAIHIDDQPYPKQIAYHHGGGGLAPLRDVTEKLSVAVSARRNADFVVLARTDCLKVTGSIAETIERCQAYVEAGVDGLVILNLAPEQVADIRAAVPGTPLGWFTTPVRPAPTTRELAAAGFTLALYPFNTVGAIADAVITTWTALRDEGAPARPLEPVEKTAKLVQQLIGMDDYWEIEQRIASSRDVP